MSRYAEKRSYDYCPETCPQVGKVVSEFYDGEFDRFIERIKDATSHKMRGVLIEVCSDLIAAEEEVEDLKKQVSAKDDELADLRRYIAELEREAA